MHHSLGNFDFETLNFHARLREQRSMRRKFIRGKRKTPSGPLGVNQAESSLGEVALFVPDNGQKKQRKETGSPCKKKKKKKRESPRRFTRVAEELRRKASLEDRGKLSFPGRSYSPSLPLLAPSRTPLVETAGVHLFISCKGCASTYAIEMKFLINK